MKEEEEEERVKEEDIFMLHSSAFARCFKHFG